MFNSLSVLVELSESSNLPIHEIVLRAEIEQSNITRQTIESEMQRRLEIMKKGTAQGLNNPIKTLGGLSNGDAYRFWKHIQESPLQPISGRLLSKAYARALAIGEVNASMGCIVATPTAGSSGILPAVLLTLQEAYGYSDAKVVEGLFTAAGIGSIFMNRIPISGADVGCQAEVGSAAGMAAAAGVELLGGNARQSSNAVGLVCMNMLGLVCDPVAGLVEFPCIKRNVAAVAQSFMAIDLALAGLDSLIPPDEIIDAMGQVGHKMDKNFRETGLGGLAVTPTGKLISERIWGKMDS